jgi:hypothetical protein
MPVAAAQMRLCRTRACCEICPICLLILSTDVDLIRAPAPQSYYIMPRRCLTVRAACCCPLSCLPPQAALFALVLLACAMAPATAAPMTTNMAAPSTNARKLTQAPTHEQWPSNICQMTCPGVGCNVQAGITGACCDGPGAPGCDVLISTIGQAAQLNCAAGSKFMCCPISKGKRT